MKRYQNIIATLNGAVKLLAFLTMSVLFMPVTLVYKHVFGQRPFGISRYFHSLLVRLLGIRVEVIGAPSTHSPVLFIANHTSYLDIPVLASVLPAAFVAKSEVADWPFFGFLAKIQNTVFIERRSTRAATQRTQLQEHLAQRQDLVLFPEGTSSLGVSVLRFKSTLFSIVEDNRRDVPITIQPVSVTCIALNGVPLLPEQRSLYAWYGDMTLPPHLWYVFKHGRFTVEVIFHPALKPDKDADRKTLAATCQEIVARGIEQSLTRRALSKA
jgi:1-acyl-sn-glycerol-3-phosphate acyltransferase